MTWIAHENESGAEELISQPGSRAAAHLKDVSTAQIRVVLHYMAAELTLSEYEFWETVQLFLGGFFFLFLLFGTRQGKIPLGMALFLLLIVAAQRAILNPQITAVTRDLEFTVPAPHREQVEFDVLRSFYLMAEAVKCGLGLILAAVLSWEGRRSTDFRQEVYTIDKANYRHIDG